MYFRSIAMALRPCRRLGGLCQTIALQPLSLKEQPIFGAGVPAVFGHSDPRITNFALRAHQGCLLLLCLHLLH